jgi:hypothetical protein
MAHLYTHDLLPRAASTLLAVFEGNMAVPVEGTQTPLISKSTFEALTEDVSLDGIVQEDYSEFVKVSWWLESWAFYLVKRGYL